MRTVDHFIHIGLQGRLHLSFLFFLSALPAFAQHQQVFYVGHSLSDQIPDMCKSLSEDHALASMDWRYQWIPGAPLRWQWQRWAANDYDPAPPHYYGFYHPQQGLPSAQFDVLVLTESVPRTYAPWGIEETYLYADSLYMFATQYRPDIRVFLYEVWHCLKSGTPTGCDWDTDASPWRQRLDDDLPMWESAVEYLNQKYQPEIPVCLIPAGQGLARLHDAITAGTVPGLQSIEELFSDDIHLTDQGKYFVACIHFAMIHNTSPMGLTNQTQVWWGGDFNAPSPALATRMQEIALETVQEYPKTCYQDGPVSVKNAPAASNLQVWPNPASDHLQIRYDGPERPWQILNMLGVPVNQGTGLEIPVRHLPPGTYILRIGEQAILFQH
jgi:hypothetical protein